MESARADSLTVIKREMSDLLGLNLRGVAGLCPVNRGLGIKRGRRDLEVFGPPAYRC